MVVRTTGDPEALSAHAAPDGRRGSIPISRPAKCGRIDEYLAQSVATPRFNATLIAGFAALALLLAGFGLYGVMAYSVAQRSREIGIRMALGAQAGDVRGMVVGAGAADGRDRPGRSGWSARWRRPRLLDSLLFGVGAVRSRDVRGGLRLLLGVVLLAAYLPARRATRVDPMVALRAE